MTTDKSPKPNKVSRPFAIGIGATEVLFILGLLLLSIGVSVLFGWAWALIESGIVLISVSIFNAVQSSGDK